jgi:large subunit ribosomal protein L17
MRHRNSGRKLGRTPAHRKALFSNLANALFEHERIETTDAKAKDLRRVAEKLITSAKRGLVAAEEAKRAAEAAKKRGEDGKKYEAQMNAVPARRAAFSYLRQPAVVERLFGEIAPRYRDRAGGYIRVTKLGRRHGDNAPVSIIELVDRPEKTAAPEEETES